MFFAKLIEIIKFKLHNSIFFFLNLTYWFFPKTTTVRLNWFFFFIDDQRLMFEYILCKALLTIVRSILWSDIIVILESFLHFFHADKSHKKMFEHD